METRKDVTKNVCRKRGYWTLLVLYFSAQLALMCLFILVDSLITSGQCWGVSFIEADAVLLLAVVE